MNTKNINFKAGLVIFFTALIALWACKEEEMNYPRTRLFMPVLNEDLYSEENTITVNMGNMKDAESYKIEVSRDSFITTDYTFQSDTNYVVLNKETLGEDLLWYTVYQIRATAIADLSEFNSLPSLLGSVRTQKFPSNMGTPTYFDVLDTRARVFWTNSGAPITNVKVFAGDDLRLENPLSQFDVTDEERQAEEKIIGGLTGSTKYQIAIFSDNNVRGWEQYNTRPPLVSGDNVVDLTGIDTGTVNLSAVLPGVADGSIILLEGGKTYLAGGYAFDKSIEFMAGYSFTPALPVINCVSNFNLVSGSNVGYVTFKAIELTSPGVDGFNGRYVFNTSVSANIGEIKFESCKIHRLRGVLRMKDAGPGVLDKYTIENCVIDSIKDYGILTVDRNDWICNNILIKNTTISKAIMLFTSRNNSNTVVIDACTINEAPEKGRQIFRWREAGLDNVTGGISILNTIWGHGWNTTGETDYLVDGYDGLGATNWIITNTYSTGDFGYVAGKEQIPGFPNFNYSGTVNDLWTDPAKSVFFFKDTGFAGKGNSGDPRWRSGI